MKGTPLYIKIDKVVDGQKITSFFPSTENPVVLSSYTYEAKRMGGAPTITDSFEYPRCLDNEFTYDEYVEFEGEKFYVTSIPSSKKENTSELYKHDITLTSRREVLDNTLFFDVVTGESEDRYRSNQTKFTFGGDIYEFVSRINSSLAYTGLYRKDAESNEQGFHVVIDEGYGTDEVKEVSFDNQYITNVLQEIYNTFGLTYYWVKDVCHVGAQQNDLTEDPMCIVEYGKDKALLSVSKENNNSKLIDIITGYGSSDNIPFYYPNEDSYGTPVYSVNNIEKGKVSIELGKLWIWNTDCYNKKMILCSAEGATADIRESLIYNVVRLTSETGEEDFSYSPGAYFNARGGIVEITRQFSFFRIDMGGDDVVYNGGKETKIAFSFNVKGLRKSVIDMSNFLISSVDIIAINGKPKDNKTSWLISDFGIDRITIIHNDNRADTTVLKKDRYSDVSTYTFTFSEDCEIEVEASVNFTIQSKKGEFSPYEKTSVRYGLTFEGGILYKCVPEFSRYIKCGDTVCSYDASGVVIENVDNAPFATSKFVFKGRKDWWQIEEVTSEEDAVQVVVTDRLWIDPSPNLMPSIYRRSHGAERFYPATNSKYLLPGSSSDFYTFKNEYREKNPHQGCVSFDDIKPTIRGIRNDVIQEDGLGQLFGEIADVAFDSNDSDVIDSDNNYLHPYFYVKLHKFSGEYGFDLFAHALASDKAVVNMIDCQGCPACSFEIQCVWSADKNKCYNCVSVDEEGNLKSLRTDSKDYILSASQAQDDNLNQNSKEKELWIAVKKDNSTLGVVMPNMSAGFKPKKGDLFVLTGINPPSQLTSNAEKRLDEALIKHMSENNVDQFTYKVNFSRIYLAENPGFTARLNENTKLAISYNGECLEMFVSNISLKCDDNTIANIEVELSKSLEVTQSDLKQTIDAVKGETVRSLENLLTGTGTFNAITADKMYLSKINADIAQSTITFLKGIVLGNRIYNISSDGIATLKEIVSSVFSSGALGTGFKLGTYGDTNDSYLEVDRMLVRKAAEFVTLVIRELRSVGGEIILTPASMKCTRVVAYSKGDIEVTEENGLPIAFYRCYFQQEADGKAVTNEFVVGDLVRCQQFNIKENTISGVKNRYYWRKCSGKGTDYIDLSYVDCDRSSDAPMAGDELVQLGNSTDEARQSAILLSAYGDDAPSIKMYRGINEYSLVGKEVVVLSREEVAIIADKLHYRTSDGTSDIIADVNGLQTSVKSLEVTQNILSPVIASNTSRISQTEKAITQEVSDRKEYVDGQVETLNSTITQTAESISLKVAQSQNTLSNVLIGSAFRDWDALTSIKASYPVTTGKGGVGGSNYAIISVSDATTNTSAGIKFGSYLVSGKKGVKYSCSLWVKTVMAADSDVYIHLTYKSTTSAMVVPTELKTMKFATEVGDWTLYKDTFEIPSSPCYITAEIIVKKNGTIHVCRPMLNEGDYIGWSMSPNDVTEAGQLEKAVTATGIDISNRKIVATADNFEVRNNNGDLTASVNENGVLAVNSGLFTGFIKKKPTVITPDNFDFYKSEETLQQGYIEMNFEKTGAFLVFSGDLKSKLGSSYLAVTLPCTGSKWTTTDYASSEHPLAYIGQQFVVVNNSTASVQIAGGGTIKKNGSSTTSTVVENGTLAILNCTINTNYNVTGNTYRAVWDGVIYKQ